MQEDLCMTFNPKQNRHLPAFLLLYLRDGQAHGGALWNRLQDILPDEWNIDSGAIYRVLKDLEDRGAVSSSWNTEEPGPAKKMYTLTDTGHVELERWYQDIQIRKRNLDYFLNEYESKAAAPKDEVST